MNVKKMRIAALVLLLSFSKCYGVSYIVNDANNPETGAFSELFFSTGGLTTGTFTSAVVQDSDENLTFGADELGYATFGATTYLTIAFDLNERGNGTNTEFNLQALSVGVQGGATFYSLEDTSVDDDDVQFFPVAVDPLPGGGGNPVEFHQGSSDIDAAIFIPASLLTANGVTPTSTITLSYRVSNLEGGPDVITSASDGTTFTLVPEPSVLGALLLPFAIMISRRKR